MQTQRRTPSKTKSPATPKATGTSQPARTGGNARGVVAALARPSLAPRPARRHAPLAARTPQRPMSMLPATLVPRAARQTKTTKPDSRIASELLVRYEPLVKKIAGGFQRKLPRNVLREDLIAAGMGGLWDAIRRHPEGASESFEWYVRVRIRGAILDELRAQDWLPRRARAAAEAASGTDAYMPPPAVVRFDDVSEWEQNRCLAEAASSELAVVAKHAHESLAKAVDLLPDRERHIVSQHYFRGVKFKDLGAELGVSEPRISQLHSRAIERLKTLISSAA